MYAAIPQLEQYDHGNLQYDANYANDHDSIMGGAFSPDGGAEDASNAFDRLLDKIGIGAFFKIGELVNKYMFGFVNLLQSIFADPLGTTLSTMLFGGLKVLLGISYTLAIIWLFTGKDLTGETNG